MARTTQGRAGALVVAVLALVACTPLRAPESSLYERLGGREGITQVIESFPSNVAGDNRVNGRFPKLVEWEALQKKFMARTITPAELQVLLGKVGPKRGRLVSRLADQLCEATGGPCAYLGKDMKSAHQGMNITEGEWNVTVENLVRALDKRRVDTYSKDQLLRILGPMKTDILGQ